MYRILVVSLLVLSFTSNNFALANSLSQSSQSVLYAKYAPERVESGAMKTERLTVKWAVSGYARNGKITVNVTFDPSRSPYTTSLNASTETFDRKDASDPTSEIVRSNFVGYINFQEPVTTKAENVDITVSANPGTSAMSGAGSPITSSVINVDMDSVREYFTKLNDIDVKNNSITALTTENNNFKRLYTLPAPNIDASVTAWDTALLVTTKSDQSVKLSAAAFRLDTGGRRISTTPDASSKDISLEAYKLGKLTIAPLAPSSSPTTTKYEIDITAFDPRGGSPIAVKTIKTMEGGATGTPIATLTRQEPPSVNIADGKEIVVRANNTVELPLVVRNASRVKVVIQKPNSIEVGGMTTVATSTQNVTPGDVPFKMNAELASGQKYVAAVRALTPVDNEEADLSAQARREFSGLQPVAKNIEMEFRADKKIRFTAITDEKARIGVSLGENLKGQTKYNSAETPSPFADVPLTDITTYVKDGKVLFTILVEAADQSGREQRQLLALKISPEDLKNKKKEDLEDLSDFNAGLEKNDGKQRLSAKSILVTGLASLLNIFTRALVPIAAPTSVITTTPAAGQATTMASKQ